MARVDGVARVARVACRPEWLEWPKLPAREAGVVNMAKMAGVAKVAGMVCVAGVACVGGVARVAGVAGVDTVARANTWLSGESG